MAGSLGQRGSLEARDQVLGSDVAVANSLNCLYGITGHGRPYLCSTDTAKGKKCHERCHRGIRELVNLGLRVDHTVPGIVLPQGLQGEVEEWRVLGKPEDVVLQPCRPHCGALGQEPVLL